jgi:putative GTP pyrophosphokinase
MRSKGYRSVHSIFCTQPLQRKVFTEVQVRTIFEEGWCEIDHHVRYPNFSDDRLVSYFLTIFNRLAGSADEMGTFVQNLTRALEGFESQLTVANEKRELALSEMDKVLGELQEMKAQDSSMKQKLSSMQTELSKLRKISAPSPFLGATSRAQLGGSLLLALRIKVQMDLGLHLI